MMTASVDHAGGDTRWSADELIPFGKYILLHRVSSGGTAAVYRAKIRGEAGFERIVAIKRILPHMAGDPEFVETFVREAKVSARLNHTNICPIYELGKVGESLYMAMEFVPGKDLGQLRKRVEADIGSLPPVVCAWIAAKLCDALDYAHNLRDARGDNAGIIHRDLSPTNVVISYEGQVKLIDFGLAKAVGKAQQTNVDALKQKLGYMSPEMVKGQPLDARSDVFGVGVLLYEMVTARRLFEGKDDIGVLTKVGRASFPPPSALVEDPPEELEQIIMTALSREREDRYQSAADMGEALTHFVLTNDPMFSPRKLADFMMGYFGETAAAEQAHTLELLGASNDPAVVEARKKFFTSAAGMVARARAEAQHKARSNSLLPPPAKVPTDAMAAEPNYPPLLDGGVQSRPPVRSPDTDGGFADEEPTAFAGGKRSRRTADAPPPERSTVPARGRKPDDTIDEEIEELVTDIPGLDEEPTGFFDSDGAARSTVATVPPPSRRGAEAAAPEPNFESEATEFLDADALEEVAAYPVEMAGFDEDATEIFFNTEEGAGLPEMLAEVQASVPASVPPGQLKPAALPTPPSSPAFASPSVGSPPSAPGLAPPPAMGAPPAGGLAPPPSMAVPVPAAAPLPAQTVPQRSGTRRITAQMAAEEIKRAERTSTIILAIGLVLLGLVVGLVATTRVGIVLGLRRPTTGAIEVRTKPAVRASIKLDEVYRGQAPLRMEGVRSGPHTIEVQMDGFVPLKREVILEGGTTALLDVAMVPTTQ